MEHANFLMGAVVQGKVTYSANHLITLVLSWQIY